MIIISIYIMVVIKKQKYLNIFFSYFLFDVLYHSTFFHSTFCPIRLFFHSTFCPVRRFFHSAFLTIRPFVPFGVFSIRRFVPFGVFSIRRFAPFGVLSFNVLSFDVLYFRRLLLRPFVGEPMCFVSGPFRKMQFSNAYSLRRLYSVAACLHVWWRGFRRIPRDLRRKFDMSSSYNVTIKPVFVSGKVRHWPKTRR
jgi:hypothetical protein